MRSLDGGGGGGGGSADSLPNCVGGGRWNRRDILPIPEGKEREDIKQKKKSTSWDGPAFFFAQKVRVGLCLLTRRGFSSKGSNSNGKETTYPLLREKVWKLLVLRGGTGHKKKLELRRQRDAKNNNGISAIEEGECVAFRKEGSTKFNQLRTASRACLRVPRGLGGGSHTTPRKLHNSPRKGKTGSSSLSPITLGKGGCGFLGLW